MSDDKVFATVHGVNKVFQASKPTIDAGVDILADFHVDEQVAVGEHGFTDTDDGAREHVTKEVAAEDDPGGRCGERPKRDDTGNGGDQHLLEQVLGAFEEDDMVLELRGQVGHPDSASLVSPHGDVEPEQGGGDERPRGVAAGKRPVVHLERLEVEAVVHRPWPPHHLLQNGHEYQVEDEAHEQVEEEHANLRSELVWGR